MSQPSGGQSGTGRRTRPDLHVTLPSGSDNGESRGRRAGHNSPVDNPSENGVPTRPASTTASPHHQTSHANAGATQGTACGTSQSTQQRQCPERANQGSVAVPVVAREENRIGNDNDNNNNSSSGRVAGGGGGTGVSNNSMSKRHARIVGAGGGGPPSPYDRSPLAMLMRSFAWPVSDEQALENSIRITLGHEPEMTPIASTGGGEHLSNKKNNSMSALQQQEQQQLSFTASYGGANSSVAVDDHSKYHVSGGASAVHTPALTVRQRSDTGPVFTSPTVPVSSQRQRQPFSEEDDLQEEDAGVNADNHLRSSDGNSNSNNAVLFPPVVPALDVDEPNNGLPSGEHLVALDDGDPYIFRYNIRVPEPPPPAQPTADPALLARIRHAAASDSVPNNNCAADEENRIDSADNATSEHVVEEGRYSPPHEHSPYGHTLEATDGVAAPGMHRNSDNDSQRLSRLRETASGEERLFSPYEPAANGDSSVGNKSGEQGEGGSVPAAPKLPHEDTSSSSEQRPALSQSPGSGAPTAGRAIALPLFSAEERQPVDEQTARRHGKRGRRKRRGGRGGSHSATPEARNGNQRDATAMTVSDAAGGSGGASTQADDPNAGEGGDNGLRMPSPLEFKTQTFITTGSFHAQPILTDDVQRERIIVDCFNALSSETRRLELLEAFYVAHMQPYEGKDSFTGDNWDDVMAKKKVKKCFGIRFDNSRYCFYVTVLRHEHRVFLFSFLLRCFCIFLFWVLMFCLVPPRYFYPGGLYFDTITTILFAGIVGTLGAWLLNIPTLIGVIWAGILWNNVPYTGRLTKGITVDIRQFISNFGLTIGIVRAGLSLNVIRFKQKLKHYIAFSIIPMASEMVVHGVCAKAIYKYPNYRWAFAEGFLLSSIAPSVVVPIIISYQRRGYGVRDGPPMMMLCSIAVDTAICVWGVQFLLALEFKTMSTALLIVLAPVQVLVGLVGGVLLGFLVFMVTFYVLFMEAERLPGVRSNRQMTLRHSVHVRYLSIGFMVLVAFTCFAVGKRFSCVGGSAIGVVTIASTFNYLCVRGGTRDHLRVKADMAQTLTTVWDYVAMPSLFGLTGAAVDVHELFARDFIGLAFALVFIGIGTRAVMAMLVPMMTRLRLSWPEILFCGIGWIGKGSVQGSMGATAQNYATKELAAATTPEEVAAAEVRIEFAKKMKNTAVLGILVACPLCSIFLTRFTSKLLKKGT